MQQIFAGINDEAKGMIAKAFMNNGFFETAAPSEQEEARLISSYAVSVQFAIFYSGRLLQPEWVFCRQIDEIFFVYSVKRK